MIKKIISITGIILFSISVRASVYVTNHGVYENNDIIFQVNYNWGNSTPTRTRPMVHFSSVAFKIISKKGWSIYNKSHVVFEGRSYVFNSGNVKNYLYKEGYRTLQEKIIKKGTVIRLVYFMKNKNYGSSFSTRKVIKKFKVYLPERVNRVNNKIRIVEI